MKEENFGDIIDVICEDAKKQSDAAEINIETASKATATMASGLGKSIDQDFKLKVVNGVGHIQESKGTWGVTLKGSFEIKSPNEGTWKIVAKVAGKTVVDKSGVKVGDKFPFAAKTKLIGKTKFDICCSWSEKKETLLTVQLHVNY